MYGAKRFLRLLGEDDAPEDDLQKDSDLSEYSTKELICFGEKIDTEISRRKEKLEGNIKVHWEGRWDGLPESKKPYLAVLTPTTVRLYDYKFLRLAKNKSGTEVSFDGFLHEGKLLRGRVEMGCDQFYLVDRKTECGLAIIEDSLARKLLRRPAKAISGDIKEW